MNNNKHKQQNLFSDCIEANFLDIIKPQVEIMFTKLKKKSPELEKEWKDLFAKNVILQLDGFLEEMSEELQLEYIRDIRLSNLKKYIENHQ